MYEGIENSPFGHGRNGGIAYIIFSSALFLFFTDLCIYFVHRILHWPAVYKHLHKPHHKWVIPSPFASHAFHPVDGYVQSLPYHIFAYIVPLHKYTYLGLFVLVNLWSIFVSILFPSLRSLALSSFHRKLMQESSSFSVLTIRSDPRLRHDHRPPTRTHHQRTSAPHYPPHAFRLQLRPVFHMGRQSRWIVQAS